MLPSDPLAPGPWSRRHPVKRDLQAEVATILKGSFDLHVHAGPDPTQERRLDALETARYAYEAEMGGFVLKSHEYPTAPLAYALNRMYPGLEVAGSVTLNREVGGLNPDAVRAAAGLGARVVWMPTHGADFFLKRTGRGPGIRLTDEAGALVPGVLEILDVVAQHGMVLASGHASPSETLTLFKQAGARGVNKLIATHPAEAATIDEQREMAALGAYVEYTFASCMPSEQRTGPKELADTLRTLGVDRCIVTTDMGQWMNPPPAEGMRMAIASLLHAGMTAEDVSKLVKTNPARLLEARPA